VSLQPLAIRLDVRRNADVGGTVIITNASSGEVRIFEVGSEWGDEAPSFDVIASGSAMHVVRKPQVYTVNVPATVALPAGGSYEIPFDLGDGTWETDAAAGALAAPDAKLVAVYEIPPSPEALEQHVWTGTVRSDPVPLH
jgi:hypothetical protein